MKGLGESMSNELGKMIGKVDQAMKITNSSGVAVSIRVTFDFTQSSDMDIKSWLAGNRTIAFQRPSRSLSADEIKGLDGTVIMAHRAGQKVRSRAEQIAELVNIGIPEQLAAIAVDNPEKFQEIMESLND